MTFPVTTAKHLGDGAQAQHRLLLLMDHSLDFLEILGRGGQVQGISGAITALTGYTPADLIGRPYSEIIHPEDWLAARAAFASVIETGRAGPVQLRYRHKDQSFRTALVTARNFLNDPQLHGILVLTHDITSQIEAESALLIANAELHRLAGQLITAQEDEGAHLARELHDDVLQMLAGLRFSMSGAAALAGNTPLTTEMASWNTIIADAMSHLRSITMRLRPPSLDSGGVEMALLDHVDRERQRTGVKITVDVGEPVGRLPADIELACFRIAQESLSNAIKHSRASTVHIAMHRDLGMVSVSITDDGEGFDVAAARNRAPRTGCVGLLGMQERAAANGGVIKITSVLNEGTTVRADFLLPTEPRG